MEMNMVETLAGDDKKIVDRDREASIWDAMLSGAQNEAHDGQRNDYSMWRCYIDRKSRPYWFNSKTGEVEWEDPTEGQIPAEFVPTPADPTWSPIVLTEEYHHCCDSTLCGTFCCSDLCCFPLCCFSHPDATLARGV